MLTLHATFCLQPIISVRKMKLKFCINITDMTVFFNAYAFQIHGMDWMGLCNLKSACGYKSYRSLTMHSFIVSIVLYFCILHFVSEPRHVKTNKMSVRLVKTQISLDIRPVWSESSLFSQLVAKYPSFLHEDSKDSDQTGQMHRLIWVFAGRTYHFVGFVVRQLFCSLCQIIITVNHFIFVFFI